MTPQCQPVVEPERQTEEPTGAWVEPVTWTFWPPAPFTYGVAVQLLLVATQAMSRPGETEPWKVPWATRLWPLVAAPARPQWPAVAWPCWVPLVTGKPMEQRPLLLMQYAPPPRRSYSGRGCSADFSTRAREAPMPAAESRERAADGRAARTTTWLLRTSTYQTGAPVVSRPAAALSRRALAASSSAREWRTTVASAPRASMDATSRVSVVATVRVPESAPDTQAPAKSVPRARLSRPAVAPASASFASRRSACFRSMPRSRSMDFSRAGGAASVRWVSAAEGAPSDRASGAVPAFAEPLSPATSRAAVAASAAPAAPARGCRLSR